MRLLVFQYAVKHQIPVPGNWQTERMAGIKWYYGYMARHKSLSLILSEVGPFKPATPKPASRKRGRQPMKSAILTSPENLADLRAKKAKRDAAAQKKAEKAANTSKG